MTRAERGVHRQDLAFVHPGRRAGLGDVTAFDDALRRDDDLGVGWRVGEVLGRRPDRRSTTGLFERDESGRESAAPEEELPGRDQPFGDGEGPRVLIATGQAEELLGVHEGRGYRKPRKCQP
jgi:hypothetical protein